MCDKGGMNETTTSYQEMWRFLNMIALREKSLTQLGTIDAIGIDADDVSYDV